MKVMVENEPMSETECMWTGGWMSECVTEWVYKILGNHLLEMIGENVIVGESQ